MNQDRPSPSKAGSDSTEWELWSSKSASPATHLAIFHISSKTAFKLYYVGRPPITELRAIMQARKPPLTTVELCEWHDGSWTTVYYGVGEPRE